MGAKQHAAEQQNKLQFRKKVAWAVKDKKGFGRLVADVGAFVQKLYAILHIEGGSENIEAINMKLQDLVSFVEGMYSPNTNVELKLTMDSGCPSTN